MSDQNEAIVTKTSTAAPNDLLAGVRQLACAWIGMRGVAAEDVGKFYQRCVARGEQLLKAQQPPAAQPIAKPPAPDAGVTAPKPATSRPIHPMSVFNAFGAVESYHIDLNAEALLPTKQELDALRERVEALAREVESLINQREV